MKITKRLSLVLAVLLMLASLTVPAMADDDYMGMQRVINCEEWVSLRSRASTSAYRICKVPLGALVDVYYYNSQFSLCYYDNEDAWGYILNEYLAEIHFAEVVNCEEWVSLRAKPSTSSARLCKVPLGEYVEYHFYDRTFSECYYNGYRGFILNDYLDFYPFY